MNFLIGDSHIFCQTEGFPPDPRIAEKSAIELRWRGHGGGESDDLRGGQGLSKKMRDNEGRERVPDDCDFRLNRGHYRVIIIEQDGLN